MMKNRKKVLFLCTGNSCRSQMAEGLARHLAGDKWEVFSAGLEPQGISSRAVEVMLERGIDISHQRSETLDPQLIRQMDVVITLCGDAAEKCPILPSEVKSLHWSLPDPAKNEGSKEEVYSMFRIVRDEIEERLLNLLNEEKM